MPYDIVELQSLNQVICASVRTKQRNPGKINRNKQEEQWNYTYQLIQTLPEKMKNDKHYMKFYQKKNDDLQHAEQQNKDHQTYKKNNNK